MASFNDLNDEDDFPAWNDLPEEWEFSLSHHADTEGSSPGSGVIPSRHWCFLGEIQSYDTVIRYRTLVKDNNGKSRVVAFYLDNYSAFDFRKLKKGHTMAIMYAHQHWFLDGTSGVRVEIPDKVQVSGRSIPEGVLIDRQPNG